MIPPCHICAAWLKRATLLKARAVRGKPVESRVHHRITPESLPVSGPPSAMTFDSDGVGAGTGTGGLGMCGDVDDGIGSDVSVHDPHKF